MITVILIIHLILAISLVIAVLLQRSEGGALGIGGGGGMGGLMTARGSANLLTRTTAVLAAAFMVTSLGLAILSGGSTEPRSILDQPGSQPPATSQPAAPVAPEKPAEPSVPLAK